MATHFVSLKGDEGCSMIAEVAEFWPEVADDLSKITWSHATNSIQLLQTAMQDGTMMIEADVSIGSNGEVIMAHPPATTSDLTLSSFINTVIQGRGGGVKVGVKLDFKLLEVVEPSLQLISSLCSDIDFPLWLNADIFGKSGSAQPVDPDSFVQLTQKYISRGTLSVGFTTSCEGNYTDQDYRKILDLNNKYQIGAPITVPLRACLLARSKKETVGYFDQAEASTTITVWSGGDDEVDVDGLVDVINTIGKNRVYVDVPDELKTQLNALSSSPILVVPAPSVLALTSLVLATTLAGEL